MPLLDKVDLSRMRAQRLDCSECVAPIRQNYCRECDEFFHEGHFPGCSLLREEGEHVNHRTYRAWTSDKPWDREDVERAPTVLFVQALDLWWHGDEAAARWMMMDAVLLVSPFKREAP